MQKPTDGVKGKGKETSRLHYICTWQSYHCIIRQDIKEEYGVHSNFPHDNPMVYHSYDQNLNLYISSQYQLFSGLIIPFTHLRQYIVWYLYQLIARYNPIIQPEANKTSYQQSEETRSSRGEVQGYALSFLAYNTPSFNAKSHKRHVLPHITPCPQGILTPRDILIF